MKKLKEPKQDRKRPGISAHKQEVKLRSVIVENKDKTGGKRTFHTHRGRGEVSSDSSDDDSDVIVDADAITLLASPGARKLEEEPAPKTRRFTFNLSLDISAEFHEDNIVKLDITGSKLTQPAPPLAFRLNPPLPSWKPSQLPSTIIKST